MKKLILLAVLCLLATTPNQAGYFYASGAAAVVDPEDRADAIGVWDMQTLNGSDVANIVPGATEYDLVLDGTPPTVTAEGLSFPEYTGANQGIAAGEGTESFADAATIYVAFRSNSLSPTGVANLISSSLATVSPLFSEQSPQIQSPDVNSPYTIDRWNDLANHIACIIIEPTRIRLYVDGNATVNKTGATTFPITLSNFNVGSLTNVFEGKVYYAGVFNTAHNTATRAEISAQIAAILAARSVTAAAPYGQVVYEGDSITETNYVVSGLFQYPYRVMSALSPTSPAICFAVHGQVISDFVSRQATIDAAFADSAAPIDVLHVLATNDIQGASSAATAYADLISYCAARKAATPGLIIIVGTAVVRDVAGYEAKRLSYNALINGGDSSYDYVADYGGDLYLGDESQAEFDVPTTYFVDGIHPNADGHLRMTNILKPILADILGITLPTEYADLKTYAAGLYVYAEDGAPELPNPGTTITITGGTGWTPGTYIVAATFPAFDIGGGTLRNVYQLTLSAGTHPLTGGTYTLP